MIPETRYVRGNDGLHVGYQVLGEGSIDLVMVPDYLTHIEGMWEIPVLASWFERLASFSRLIMFDQPGSGVSDPVPLDRLPTLEQYVDNVRVVMDAAGSERAALITIDNSTATGIVFAATHPERTSAVVLMNGYARVVQADGYPFGVPADRLEQAMTYFGETWGTGEAIARLAAPSIAGNDDEVRLWARLERLSQSPGSMVPFLRMFFETDVRHVLPVVRVPTLVLHRKGNRFVVPEAGRYLAEHIPGARLVELDGDDHMPWYGDSDAFIGEIQEFLTGERAAPVETDRVLATLLYTDIVGSTERAAELGDRRWREVLDRHDEMIRRALERFRGREVKTTGDGVLATFDGPARAIRAAATIRAGAERLGFQIRAGVHTGEVELRGQDIGGIAANVGARVMREAAPGEVIVTSTVCDLVAGSGIAFADRGARVLRGVPGEWRLYAVEEG